MSWRDRPTRLIAWPESVDFCLFVDENGTSDLDSVARLVKGGGFVHEGERFFTVTGCAISLTDLCLARMEMDSLKKRFWPPEGLCYNPRTNSYRKVVFRSYDVRAGDGPFHPDQIDRAAFLPALTQLMARQPLMLFSVTIDKVALIERYTYPMDPYDISMTFILERFGVFFLGRECASGVVVMEARGRREDAALLRTVAGILERGTAYRSADELARVSGVYFNSKWDDQIGVLGSAVCGLELADLSSQPLDYYQRTGKKSGPFAVLEPKLWGYPNYLGKGLKLFPEK